MWSNWSRGQSCAPAEQLRPGTSIEVAQAVARGRAVRVAGAGHSFSGGVPTDGTLLSLERMDRVLDVDRASGLVRAQAGIGLRRLVRELHRHGLALPNLGDVDAQSLGGALATGTHGTGVGLGNLSSAVTAMELVLADGSERVVDAGDELAAARVGLGALGVGGGRGRGAAAGARGGGWGPPRGAASPPPPPPPSPSRGRSKPCSTSWARPSTATPPSSCSPPRPRRWR